jgi:hypothetical protein
MGCGDKAYIVFLSSEKEFCGLCVYLWSLVWKKLNNRRTLNGLKHIKIKYFLVFSLFSDILLPGYCPWGAGGHTPTQRRSGAKTRSVRRKLFYEMDREDTSIV